MSGRKQPAAKDGKSIAATRPIPRQARAATASTTGKARRMTAAEVREAFRRWQAREPEPKTELEYTTPFELLVAVALSAQSTDAAVNRVTRTLFALANTPAGIAALGVEGVKPHLAHIGLYNAKAANVVRLAELLLERHGGAVPADRSALQALPGVGRKTANVVLNTVFGQPTLAVDTHVFRVANRTGMAPGKDVRVVEDGLLSRIPAEYLHHAHHWLILHGRYVCTARRPACGACPIRDLCHWPGKP